MTHSPTPTELLALRTANAALLNSRDASYDFAATIVFALGSAQLLQSPETAAELVRLRAQVAEQEEVRVDLWAHLDFRLRDIKRLRARVAELEAERGTLVAARDAQIIAWLGKKAREYGTSNRESRDKAEAVFRMADKLSRGAVRQPVEAERPDPRRDASVAKLRALLAGQREDPHDGPLHHEYRIARDLPEAPRA